MASNESRRNPHLRLACARCQRRKIRCDGQYPACSNCRKAAAECIDGDSVRLRSGPADLNNAPGRGLFNKLRRRVTWLESIIRERLPDVDLSTTPSRDDLEQSNVEERVMMESPDSVSRRECQDDSVPDLAPVPTNTLDQRTHEIGMISIGFNADQKYIGPSSGYFLARLLLANSRRTGDLAPSMSSRPLTTTQSSIDELVSAAQGPLLLPSQYVAFQLAQVYFDTIQPQHPFLHEESFRAALDQIYRDGAPVDFVGNDDGSIYFQTYMVLAISATVSNWRTKRHIPGESYCLSALRYLDRIRLGTSIEGLQCMLLLLLFTMYSPHMQLNVWNLNYQCLAAVIDLGLQRHVAISAGISQHEQDMRTRIFWTVFTIDRTIASMMGRPIGLRDEACELRLPQLPTDAELSTHPDHANGRRHSMAVSIHLFKLAKLNSEINDTRCVSMAE
ncbi:unnamed protein product [Alternaria alternata]